MPGEELSIHVYNENRSSSVRSAIMKKLCLCVAVVCMLSLAFSANAQQGGRGGAGGAGGGAGGAGGQGGIGGQGGASGGPGGQGGAGGAGALFQKIMALDTNGDGQLTTAEVTDTRTQNLLKGTDTNGDGQVSRAELQQALASGSRAVGGPGMGPPPGGPRPQPGEVLPVFVQDQLQLSDTQRQQVAALQKEVNARLAEILTVEQQAVLQQGPPENLGGPGNAAFEKPSNTQNQNGQRPRQRGRK